MAEQMINERDRFKYNLNDFVNIEEEVKKHMKLYDQGYKIGFQDGQRKAWSEVKHLMEEYDNTDKCGQ